MLTLDLVVAKADCEAIPMASASAVNRSAVLAGWSLISPAC